MQIWKLAPLDKSALHWRASDYRGIVIVRAKSEADARQCAGARFAKASTGEPRADARLSPWTQDALISCEELDSNDQTIGEEGFLNLGDA